MRHFFTSESVTEGHPDKICDQISDSILDEILAKDPNARVACETSVTTGLVLVAGEITTSTYVDIPKIVRETIKGIGYTRAKYGFDAETCAVLTSIDEQSADIAQGVDRALESREGTMSDEEIEAIGAGDQGLMFGFACNETEELMPLPILLANKLTMQLAKVRKQDKNTPLKPDGKSQVTVEYEDNMPKRISTIVIASQHIENITQEELKEYIKEKVINKIIPTELVDKDTEILINTSGSFIVGGPFGDSGTTGRKIVVDNYGGSSKVGGGCFSSKDPTKVDRSAAYYARYVAKNIVYNQLCDICEIGVSYTIGNSNPISLNIETFGTNKVSLEEIYKFVNQNFDFRVSNILNELDLRRPIYYDTASYGHFGRTDVNLPWEQIKRIQ